MLCPHTRRLADHWATTKTGAVPAGTFGRHMSKAWFWWILQNLHFSNNADQQAGTDRAWKVRPVVGVLLKTFRAGYDFPPVLSFDEAIIPSRSRHNVTRQLDVYCGSDQHASELGGHLSTRFSADPNSGPAAVIRNLHEILPSPEDGVFHVVVTDRFYTSAKLALQLLARNIYMVGTIQTNEAGYPQKVKAETETRPKGVPCGDTKLAIAKACLELTLLRW
ncbi:unnamed protein product [Phytophthora fragariaefolia]|uniref:Unnamed protein product n=1 Tax=Phytophthora fragariaefolia TaxID=1490495 RepID=A0A9W6TKE6_9STRA|nr:unnamed protein product [Phytophthora fragariaefolia]